MGEILHGVRYWFSFNQFIEDLKKAKKMLEVKQEDVKKRKEEAEKKSEEILPFVKKWLDDVHAILEDVNNMQQKLEEGRKNCFNVSHRHSLANKAENKVKQMMELIYKSDFEHISLPIRRDSTTEVVFFDSWDSTYFPLWEELAIGEKKMIGLYGMSGSGKTILAKELLGKALQELKVFDKVVTITVSKHPDDFNIQQEIAKEVGLTFPQEKNQLAARAQIMLSLLKDKKIFIILDDVRRKLSLEQIGIPLNEGGCCVLLTTRFRRVCISMKCEIIIEQPLLTEEDAWYLFTRHAPHVSVNEFDTIGRKIVQECNGLPKTIMTVGSTLNGKSIEEWESTLQRLKHFLPLDTVDDLKDPEEIERRYDNLQSPLAKSLFILCSMFPKDHDIHIEDLIRFGKRTLQLGDNIHTMEDVRYEVLVALEILLDYCLLMRSKKEACVQLPVVVQDVALHSIEKKHYQQVLDSDAYSNMSVSNLQRLKNTKALSLWNLQDENFKLSNQLCCSTLEILLLQPHGFVEELGGLEALRVLAIIISSFDWRLWQWKSTICSIPRSIRLLRDLHTLCLRGKKLDDISFLSELKGLEILDLRGSLFNELPAGIANMKLLKLLDVFHCEIRKSPLEVLGRCEQLEELYFWDKKSTIPKDFSLSKLKRFVIYDSTCSIFAYKDPFLEYLDSFDDELRAFCIQGFRVSDLNPSMKGMILGSDCLWLDNCGWDHKHINPEIKHLGVSRCQEKRFINDGHDVDNPETEQVFSHLITLRLSKMHSLEQVFQGSSIRLPRLRKLEIDGCNKVKWMFSSSLSDSCPSLAELQICYCSELERLVDIDSDADDEDELHLLKLKELNLQILPKLREIFGGGFEGKIEPPHDKQESPPHEHEKEKRDQVNSNLRSIRLDGLLELEFIWKISTQIVNLHRLEHVTLCECPKLKNLFTLATIRSFPELKELKVFECKEWEGIFCEESLKNLSSSASSSSSSSSNVSFPKLQKISISGCGKVRWLLSYSMASHCPSLEQIKICNCSELERLVYGDNIEEAAPEPQLPLLNVKELSLQILPSLTEVFEGGFVYKPEFFHDNQESSEHEHENDRVKVVDSELCSVLLYDLKKLQFIWKGTTPIMRLHKLEHVSLQECPKLKSIFTLAIVTSLPKLRELRVFDCEEWGGLFCEESIKNITSSSFSNVCFPKLEVIRIFKCRKVRRLFSYSLASHCPSLKKMIIYDCSQLEGVVQAYEGEEVDSHDILFPELTLLGLKELPNLTEIFPSYEKTVTKIIQDCPNIICNNPLEDKVVSSDQNRSSN